MRDLREKVAVITGGASGIGRALSDRFGRAGMKVVLVDIEDDAMQAAVRKRMASIVDQKAPGLPDAGSGVFAR